MVSFKELVSRIKDFYGFSKQEWTGIIPAIIITAFIFSFRDWGTEQFNLASGLSNLFLVLIITIIAFFFRISCQKIYGLSRGFKPEYKVWWTGLFIALILTFITNGRIPLIISGVTVSSFMIKQRLGEMRYGFSMIIQGIIGLWGVLGNLILAIIFAIGAFAYPENYFFNMGIVLNLVMAFCALIPLPQLDGLNIYFGSRLIYMLGWIAFILAFILLWVTRTKIGLVSTIIIGSIIGIIFILIGSEK